jgi:hypothetical protein
MASFPQVILAAAAPQLPGRGWLQRQLLMRRSLVPPAARRLSPHRQLVTNQLTECAMQRHLETTRPSQTYSIQSDIVVYTVAKILLLPNILLPRKLKLHFGHHSC